MKEIIKAYKKWSAYGTDYSIKEKLFHEKLGHFSACSTREYGFYAGYKAGQKAEREKGDITDLRGLPVEMLGDYIQIGTTEWLPLEIDNLLGDILTGDYEFRWEIEGNLESPFEIGKDYGDGPINVGGMLDAISEDAILHYRPIQKEPTAEEKAEIIAEHMQPTHEEIMTLWWKAGDNWYRVKAFHENGPSYDIGELNRDKGYFIGRKSSLIPPEK